MLGEATVSQIKTRQDKTRQARPMLGEAKTRQVRPALGEAKTRQARSALGEAETSQVKASKANVGRGKDKTSEADVGRGKGQAAESAGYAVEWKKRQDKEGGVPMLSFIQWMRPQGRGQQLQGMGLRSSCRLWNNGKGSPIDCL
eukprot:1158606-Pelagomonas_calceolata.AAC.8